jgi:hypothetical protein
MGCGGRGRRRRLLASDEALFAYGEVVWFWRRDAGAKLAVIFASDGDNKPAHRGEHDISRKAIAQGMSECSPLTCMLVCAFLCATGTRDRGCSAHPAFPAPSVLKRDNEFGNNSGKPCRENADACHAVIASEAKQSIFPLAALWITSPQALLAMTVAGDLSAAARRAKTLTLRAPSVSCWPDPTCDTALPAAARRSRAGRDG